MRGLAMAIAAAVIGAAPAAAQDGGSVGITMGYPASVGVIWHVTDRVALRPEVSWTKVSSTSTASITSVIGIGSGAVTTTTTSQSTNDQSTVGVGASGLIAVRQWDALRAYLSPRFLYTRGSTTSSSVNSFTGSSTPIDFTIDAYFVSGSVGVQYALSDRFGIYGEVGLGYNHQTSSSATAGSGTGTTTTVATRSGAGVIFYFR